MIVPQAYKITFLIFLFLNQANVYSSLFFAGRRENTAIDILSNKMGTKMHKPSEYTVKQSVHPVRYIRIEATPQVSLVTAR